jgi:hypothetical protein
MTLKAHLLKSLVATYEVRDLILSRFEPTANHRDCVRRGDVGRFVADRLGVEWSPRLQRRTNQAARLAGFVRYNNTDGIPRFTNIRAK